MEFTIEIELTSILFRTAAIDPADPNRCPAVTYNAAQRLPCLVAPGNRFHRSNCLAHLSRTMSYLSVMLHKLTARCQHFRNLLKACFFFKHTNNLFQFNDKPIITFY